ncbi:MAG: diaminopimelate decarboxylase [Arenicellales bacterium]
MDHFQYQDGQLFAEQVSLEDIADQVGTPCYVYSRATLERHWHAFDNAFGDYPHLVCYAVKANGNLAILNLLARLGSGFDIVSGGELRRVIAAGGDPTRTVFSGVCKQDWELKEALEAGVRCFNIESEGELENLSEVASIMGKVAPISVRINPDVDAKTHPYISTGLHNNKFGLPVEAAMAVYRKANQDPNIEISGVACHIGSQLTDLGPYNDALGRVLDFIDALESSGIAIDHIDFGGGLGVRYHDETPPSPAEYWDILNQQLSSRGIVLPITIEPGRAIVGNAGILLTRVNFLKLSASTRFCIVDAGMNDLIRPALYQAYQEIVPIKQNSDAKAERYDVVGPICESGDFLGKDRLMQVEKDDLLAVRTAGAYSAVMASNYNARPRPAEVMVDGERFFIVRERESLQQLYQGEQLIPG